MRIAVCIDDRGGMLFNRRRQSQDRLLRQDLLREAAGGPLWMSPYSRGQFSDTSEQLRAEEDFPRRAGAGELCFFEDVDPAPWLEAAEEVILYRWNRTYPYDLKLDLCPEEAGFTLAEKTEFAGSSHEKITREVYLRKEDAHG